MKFQPYVLAMLAAAWVSAPVTATSQVALHGAQTFRCDSNTAADRFDGHKLRHRERAVTSGDFDELSSQTPGVDVHRPQAPAAITTPDQKSKTLRPPVIDDRVYRGIDNKQNDSRVYQLDRESGEVRFGDGSHGRRLPASEGARAGYRHGTGQDENAPAVPSPSPTPRPVPIPYPNIGIVTDDDCPGLINGSLKHENTITSGD